MKKLALLLLTTLINVSSFTITVHAEENEEEQDKSRDEENRHEITDWLSLAAEIKLEQKHESQVAFNDTKSTVNESTNSIELDFFLEASDTLKGELALEIDDEKKRFKIDEAIALFELGKTEIELGKTTLPFGEYSTNFINDSSTIFAETKAKGLIVRHTPFDELEFSLFAHKGDVKSINTNSNSLDWGIATEFSPNNSWKFGIAYISDLADAEDLEFEDNQYEKRVAGIAANGLYELGDYEITVEYISALDSFSEFDFDRNKPSAWNIELSHSVSEKTEWALRYSGSKELEDEPRRQYGISGKWHINKNMTWGLEYLKSDYKNDFAEDSQERPLSKSKGFATELNILFK